MALNLGAVVMKLDADASGLISATNKANMALAGVGRMASNVGKQGLTALNNGVTATANIMKTTFVGGAVALVGGLVGATVASVKFNETMANVASLMPGATERVKELKAEVQSIAIETGKSTDDIGQGLYQVISAFGDTADSAKILGINAKAGMAGLATTVDAINLTSAVTKAYGDTSALAVQKASDLALMTVRLGQTTFPELAGSVGRVTPLMKQLGGSQEELFAVMATMTGVTGGAAEVSTQLSGALQSVMVPTKDTTALMKKMGFANGEAMVKSLGVQGSIKAMVDEAKKSGKPLQSYIGSIEGQVLALGLAGPQAEDYKKKLAEMANAAGATDAAFREQTSGINYFGFKMNQIKSKIEVFMQKIEDAFSPQLKDLADAVGGYFDKIDIDLILNAFQEIFQLVTSGGQEAMDGGMWIDQLFGSGTAEKISFISQKASEFYGFITSNTPESQAVLVGLAGVVGGAVVSAFALMAGGVILATWPFIAIGLAIGGLFYLFQTNLPLFAAAIVILGAILWAIFIPALWAKVTALYAAAGAWLALNLPIVGIIILIAIVVATVVWLWQNWNWIWPAIVAVAGMAWEAIKGFFAPIGRWFMDRFSEAWGGITRFFGGIGQWFGDRFSEVKGHFDSLMAKATAIKDGIVGAFKSMQSAVGDVLKGVVNSIISNLNNAIGGVNAVIRNIPDIPGVGKIPTIPKIPSFSSGVTNFQGGLAYVHEDEMLTNLPKGTDVLTATETSQVTGKAGGKDSQSKSEKHYHFHFEDIVVTDDKSKRDLVKSLKRIMQEEGI